MADATNLPNLAYLQKMITEKSDPAEKSPFRFPSPIMQTLGLSLTAIGDGTATMAMDTKTGAQSNPMGTVHGGVLCDIADAAIGTAHAATLQAGESFTSVDLQINFFRPVWDESIQASAKIVHRGRTLTRYVCDVTRPADGKLIAQVTSTVMTLRGDAAQGR